MSKHRRASFPRPFRCVRPSEEIKEAKQPDSRLLSFPARDFNPEFLAVDRFEFVQSLLAQCGYWCHCHHANSARRIQKNDRFATCGKRASLGKADGRATIRIMQAFKEALDQRTPNQPVPAISATFKDGGILELVHDVEARRTQFAFWRNGTWEYEDSHAINPIHRLVPYSASNNLIRNEIVLLPKAPEEYGTEERLLADIRDFIHRYVDVSPLYEEIAGYYVLFSWIYDGFNELPYLRVRGDPGSGKTRFLLTVGSLCYKPIFASGASTVSPLFRLLETFRGTLIIDESDFRFSDEKAEMVKILNNGNVRGFPVLRSESSGRGEFNPRAYHVFGPKIVATRGDFEDRALESRFLTEEMGTARMRDAIPINLPPEHKAEASALRNKLLLFRFRNLRKRPALAKLVDRTLEPRLNQIFVPLLSIIQDPKALDELRAVARQCQRELISERGLGSEAQVLEVIRELLAANADGQLSIKEISDRFTELYSDDYDHKITSKWIGYVIRKKLRLKSVRGRDGYVLSTGQLPRLEQLYEGYGLAPSRKAHLPEEGQTHNGQNGSTPPFSGKP